MLVAYARYKGHWDKSVEDGEKATADMVVNNFDLRLNGPEILTAGIYPNIHGFLPFHHKQVLGPSGSWDRHAQGARN